MILFEVIPERSVRSIPIKLGDEHLLAVPASGGFSSLQMQKQGKEHKAATKEQEYEKQDRFRKRILIVDNEPDITIAFEKGFRDKGLEQIDSVNDPILALRNFKAGSYDLLIIDVMMPQMDGFELYEEIRKIDTKVKVCFITAFEVNYQALRAVFSAASATDDMAASFESQLM
jgi:CheY-like chemotaxis protein